MSKEFKSGQEVFHKSLGKGVFLKYDLHEGEAVVEFTDKDGYKDELRVTTLLLRTYNEEHQKEKVISTNPLEQTNPLD